MTTSTGMPGTAPTQIEMTVHMSAEREVEPDFDVNCSAMPAGGAC